MQGRWRPGGSSCHSCLASNRNRTAPVCPPTPECSDWTCCAQGTKKTLLLCSFGHLTNILWFQSFWFSLKFKTQRPSNLFLVYKYISWNVADTFVTEALPPTELRSLKSGAVSLSLSQIVQHPLKFSPPLCSLLRQVIKEAHPVSDALILCHLYTKLSSEVLTPQHPRLRCLRIPCVSYLIQSFFLVFLEPLPLFRRGNIDGRSSIMRPPMNVKKSWKMSKHARICLGSAELSSILSRPSHVGWRSSIWRQDFPRSSIRLERQPVSLLSSTTQRGKGKIELWITLIWYF